MGDVGDPDIGACWGIGEWGVEGGGDPAEDGGEDGAQSGEKCVERGSLGGTGLVVVEGETGYEETDVLA